MVKSQLPSGATSINMSNFTTDPFAISTLSVALLSWIIAFAGSIASASNTKGEFPKFTWWGLVFQLLLMVGTFFIYAFDMLDQYKNFLTSGYAIAFIYTTNSATNLVNSSGASKAAAAAGVILLSMVNLIYVFYFGSDNSTPINQWIDSFSLKGPRSTHNPFLNSNSINRHSMLNSHSVNNDSTVGTGQRYVSSTRLNGFENVSERDPSTATGTNINTPVYDVPDNEGTYLSANSDTNTFGVAVDDFPYTARALYSYESNPDDENEISFEKGEVLKVNDINSRWWQAKRSNGDIGICPSNYVELIE